MERSELLLQVRMAFFSEEAARPIALSDSVLRDDLCRALEELETTQPSEELVEEAYELVWRAR